MATAVSRATGAGRRRATETKQSFKTTEFWVYVGVLVALFIAGAVTGDDATTDTADALPADDVWRYAILLTIGYLVSRGLAKAGSRDPYTDEGATSGEGPGLGDRVRAATEALREGDTGTHDSSAHGTAGEPAPATRRGL